MNKLFYLLLLLGLSLRNIPTFLILYLGFARQRCIVKQFPDEIEVRNDPNTPEVKFNVTEEVVNGIEPNYPIKV